MRRVCKDEIGWKEETNNDEFASLNRSGCNDYRYCWNCLRQTAVADWTLTVLGTMVVMMICSMGHRGD